ncbi:EF-hand domain-containing protein [Sphingomonas sp. RS2018]
MMKTAMMVSALAIATPAFAQEAQSAPASPTTTAPTADQTAPGRTPLTAADPATAAPPAQTAEAAPVTPAQEAPAQVAAAPAAAPPATGATQIAQVVSTEFPTYDKNADAKLDKAEFGAWMVALKTASDPSTKAGDPATTKWVSGAFASADTDKSKGVSQAELTKYLSQNAG